jgi:hypothetical protein
LAVWFRVDDGGRTLAERNDFRRIELAEAEADFEDSAERLVYVLLGEKTFLHSNGKRAGKTPLARSLPARRVRAAADVRDAVFLEVAMLPVSVDGIVGLNVRDDVLQQIVFERHSPALESAERPSSSCAAASNRAHSTRNVSAPRGRSATRAHAFSGECAHRVGHAGVAIGKDDHHWLNLTLSQ